MVPLAIARCSAPFLSQSSSENSAHPFKWGRVTHRPHGTSLTGPRQSFLGPDSRRRLPGPRLVLQGSGGGGSHTASTARARRCRRVTLSPIQISSRIRTRTALWAGPWWSVAARRSKVHIAERIIRGLPHARIVACAKPWHDLVEALRACDVIVGALHSYKEREQLQVFARRNLIPYIDVGPDVHALR